MTGLRRLGKRIVIALEGGLHLVVHLMIAGRLRWRPAGAKLPGRVGLAAFEFASGILLMTEASTRQRASGKVPYAAACRSGSLRSASK